MLLHERLSLLLPTQARCLHESHSSILVSALALLPHIWHFRLCIKPRMSASLSSLQRESMDYQAVGVLHLKKSISFLIVLTRMDLTGQRDMQSCMCLFSFLGACIYITLCIRSFQSEIDRDTKHHHTIKSSRPACIHISPQWSARHVYSRWGLITNLEGS